MSRGFQVALGVVLAVALVLVLVAWRAGAFDGANDYRRPDRPTTKPAVVVPVVVDVTGRELYEAYAKDRTAADAAYAGKTLRVNCIVGKEHGATSLDLEVAGGADHMEAWFTDESAPAMRNLKHYDEVFIRCRSGGMLDVVTLRDCVLEQVVPPPK